MISRLNNDVIGAQNAISNTIISIITDVIQAIALIFVMVTIEWRMTLVSVAILPLFILAARIWVNACGTLQGNRWTPTRA